MAHQRNIGAVSRPLFRVPPETGYIVPRLPALPPFETSMPRHTNRSLPRRSRKNLSALRPGACQPPEQCPDSPDRLSPSTSPCSPASLGLTHDMPCGYDHTATQATSHASRRPPTFEPLHLHPPCTPPGPRGAPAPARIPTSARWGWPQGTRQRHFLFSDANSPPRPPFSAPAQRPAACADFCCAPNSCRALCTNSGSTRRSTQLVASTFAPPGIDACAASEKASANALVYHSSLTARFPFRPPHPLPALPFSVAGLTQPVLSEEGDFRLSQVNGIMHIAEVSSGLERPRAIPFRSRLQGLRNPSGIEPGSSPPEWLNNQGCLPPSCSSGGDCSHHGPVDPRHAGGRPTVGLKPGRVCKVVDRLLAGTRLSLSLSR